MFLIQITTIHIISTAYNPFKMISIPLQVSGKEAFILFLFFLLLLYSVVTFLKSWNKNYRDINHLPFYTMCEDKTSIAPGGNFFLNYVEM